MLIQGKPQRTIRVAEDGRAVLILDETRLPHEIVTVELRSVEDAAREGIPGVARLFPESVPRA